MGLKDISEHLRDDQKLENYIDDELNDEREELEDDEIDDADGIPLWKERQHNHI